MSKEAISKSDLQKESSKCSSFQIVHACIHLLIHSSHATLLCCHLMPINSPALKNGIRGSLFFLAVKFLQTSSAPLLSLVVAEVPKKRV
jgi:hypothetical protein